MIISKSEFYEVMKSLVSRVQDAYPKQLQGKVEVYDFSVSARIPTEQRNTSYFLYELIGHDSKGIILSPNGGRTQEAYSKPLRELDIDSPTGSGCYSGEGEDKRKHTKEDTKRYWLLNNSEFRKDLVSQGWLAFDKVKKLSDFDKKRMRYEGKNNYTRNFSIGDLTKAIAITDNGNIDYGLVLRDLEELKSFGENISYIYAGGDMGSGESIFYMSIKNRGDDLSLKLGRLECVSNPDKNKNTMERKISFGVGFGKRGLNRRPDWWNEEIDKRTKTLVREYVDKNGINNISVGFCREKREGFDISISNRKHDEEVFEPETGVLIKQALGVRNFADSVIAEEHSEHDSIRKNILDSRRRVLGL